MNLIIDETNYESYIIDRNIIIQDDFFSQNEISQYSILLINGILDKEVGLRILNVNQPKVKVIIENCAFEQLYVTTSVFLEIKILNVEIATSIRDDFAPFNTQIHNSKIEQLFISKSNFPDGILIHKQSSIHHIDIFKINIKRSFTFLNSTTKTFTLQSSTLGDVSIEGSDYPVKDVLTSVEKIFIFNTTVCNYIKIFQVDFSVIQLYRVKVNKTESHVEIAADLFITIPPNIKNHVVDEISILESEVCPKLFISANKIKRFSIKKSKLSELAVKYWRIDDVKIHESSFSGSFNLGPMNCLTDINKLEVENCHFINSFGLNHITFKEECKIKSCIFEKYPSLFNSCDIEGTCMTDFSFTSLRNFVFQGTNFTYFSFKNLDISNAEFDNCIWQNLGARNFVVDEGYAGSDIQKLISLKDIYSKLKSSCQKKSDFINYGRFHVSEQEIKRRIFKHENSFLDYILLSFHKWLSEYGENFKKPLLYIVLFLLFFSWIYLFTGFYIGERLVKYELSFNPNNGCQTFVDFFCSMLFSLKNIVPFNTSLNFFIHSDIKLPKTQAIELFHKLFNFVFVASFTAALVKQIRK